MLNEIKNQRTTRTSEEGFTMLELMIVIVIIGILTAIAIPIFLGQQRQAHLAGLKSDIKNTQSAIATALAKNPTARYVSGFHYPCDDTSTANCGQGYGQVSNDPTISNTTPMIGSPSHPSTVGFGIPISAKETYISVGGQWDNYTVCGFLGMDASGDNTQGQAGFTPLYNVVWGFRSTDGQVKEYSSMYACQAG